MSDSQLRDQRQAVIDRNREKRLAQMAEAQRQADERNRRRGLA
ncbi:hypothetical protein [Catenuloplanes indicus]|uniref:Uncharacterized protein n=1 Tax=Catenuloplanes indicus TaxID=137267 RepID=A0AAE3W1X7_9ACTN|nr:hypothetical protein [Catenuloplanes indicus]MDQ0367974.1 hypothetical protein [Catenuloplanes indicus]